MLWVEGTQGGEDVFHLSHMWLNTASERDHNLYYLTCTHYSLIWDSTFFKNLQSQQCPLYRTEGSDINSSLGAETPFKVHKKPVKLRMKGERGGKNVIRAPLWISPRSHCLSRAVKCSRSCRQEGMLAAVRDNQLLLKKEREEREEHVPAVELNKWTYEKSRSTAIASVIHCN